MNSREKKECIEIISDIKTRLNSLDRTITDIEIYGNDFNPFNQLDDIIIKIIDMITSYTNHSIRDNLSICQYHKEHLMILMNNFVSNKISQQIYSDARNERQTSIDFHKQELLQLIKERLHLDKVNHNE
jgi:hypothetical protein